MLCSSPCAWSRRRFLAASGAACLGTSGWASPQSPGEGGGIPAPRRVRIIFALHAPQQDRPDWPNVGFDFQPHIDRITAALTRGRAELDFETSLAPGPEDAQRIIAEHGEKDDGYLVVQMNCWNRVVQPIAATGKPVLYADFPYGGSGGFLVYTARFRRNGTPHLGFVSSSKLEDLVAAAACFATVDDASDFGAAVAAGRRRATPGVTKHDVAEIAGEVRSPGECVERMRAAKILAVGGGWPDIGGAIESELGIAVEAVEYAELNAAWEEADPGAACMIADRWEREAIRIEGVDRETLEASAAMVLAQRAVLAAHGANAITINCLGGFYGGHIQAYPCLGFHELLNEGKIGACECDLRSTATMVAISALAGDRPGFISDPVIDTARRRIVYAHCVASKHPFGSAGPASPFEILTHSEDRAGASVRALLPTGCMTTTVELAPERKTILFHQGVAVTNDLDDRACRTKLAVEPLGDLEKLFGEWDQWNWHRVTYYGDLREPVFALADRLGWSVLEEA